MHRSCYQQLGEVKLVYLPLVLLPFVVVAALLINSHSSATLSARDLPALIKPVVTDNPIALGEFSLRTSQGLKYGVEEMKGKWTFLFFGYTHCPDVCPATMSQLDTIVSRLNQRNMDANVLFVSVDPQRDTEKELSEYVSYFNRRFIAATGDSSEIKKLERQLGAAHRFSTKDGSGNYSVSHSTSIYLLGPNVEVYAKFSIPMNVRKVVDQYAGIVGHFSNKSSS